MSDAEVPAAVPSAHSWSPGTLWPGLRIAGGFGAVAIGVLGDDPRSEEHTSELQSRFDLVCRLLLEKKKKSKRSRRKSSHSGDSTSRLTHVCKSVDHKNTTQ